MLLTIKFGSKSILYYSQVLVPSPPVHKPLTKEEPVRPPSTDPLLSIPVAVGASLKSALEAKLKLLNLEDQDKKDGNVVH